MKKMKKSRLHNGLPVLIIALCLSLTAVTIEAEEEKPKLGIDLDATVVSKYIWRGFDIFDDHGAFQPSVDVDLFGTGFSVNVWESLPFGGGNDDLNELDYTIAYNNTLFADEVYALDWGINYIYYDFFRAGSKFVPDADEIGVSLSLPKLIKLGPGFLVPGYYGAKLWPRGDEGNYGTFHTLSLSYDWTIPETELALHFYGDINYNDQMLIAESDWTHSTLGISTSFDLKPFTITPFVNYQISFDDAVNSDDEFWGGVSASINF